MDFKKIIYIKNIGKFEDSSPDGNCEFKKVNLIFAPNGQGKTTLSNIFRSLSLNDPSFILGRKTLGRDGNPEVHLRFDGENIQFKNGSWDKGLSEIEIYDTRFVNENIFSGLSVDHSHKKNMFNIVIGKEGVILANDLTDSDDNIKDKNREISQKEKELKVILPKDLTIDQFLDLEEDKEAQAKLIELDKTIEAFNKKEQIESKSLLSTYKVPVEYDDGKDIFSKIEDMLAKTIDTISSEAENLTKKHLSRCTLSGQENWLEDGLSVTKDDACPFCGQDIKGNDLIKSYRDYFSEAYGDHKEAILKLSINIKENLIPFNSTVISAQEMNLSLLEYWMEYIDSDLSLNIDFSSMTIQSAFKSGRDLLALKRKAPLEQTETSKEYESLRNSVREVISKIETRNNEIENFNELVKEYKEGISKADSESNAKTERKIIKNQILRYKVKSEGICNELVSLRSDKKDLEDKKSEIKEKLDEYSTKMPSQFEEQINKLLLKFGASFKLSKKQASFRGGRPSSTYKISINDVDIDLGDAATGESQPSFKNTLSEGDKNTLAFAFFLVKQLNDAGISEKIIIIDDPVSSLDPSRKEATKRQIVNLSSKSKQVIVLSHDPLFLKLIWREISKDERKSLNLFRKVKQSVLGEWDIEDATKGSYFQDYSTLLNYLHDASSEDARHTARCMRPLLEGNFRVRFPSEFNENQWLGDFISKIREASEGQQLNNMKAHLEELEDINGYSKKYHHNDNPNADNEPIEDSELTSYITRTFEVMKGVMYDF